MDSEARPSEHEFPSTDMIFDVFTCFICLQRLKDARLCPHCSKLCCYPCISRWIVESRAQCPHCQNPLELGELVNCRWAEDVATRLHSAKPKLNPPKTSQNNPATEKCLTHKENLTVFCVTCNSTVCHQCALFDIRHNEHEFRPLDDVLRERMKELCDDIHKLDQRRIALATLGQQTESRILLITRAKEACMDEIQHTVESFAQRLNQTLRDRLSPLVITRAAIVKETRLLDVLQQEVLEGLHRFSRSRLVKLSAEFRQVFDRVQSNPLASFACPVVDTKFTSELTPEFESAQFRLTDYAERRVRGDPVYSGTVRLCGLGWRLKVYPDGNGVVRGDFLSVFLELMEAPRGRAARYEYRIEIVPAEGAVFSREFASEFEAGDCWGYNRFVRLDRLAEEAFISGDVDILTIRFHVRPSSLRQLCDDLRWRIRQSTIPNAEMTEELVDGRLMIVTLPNDDEVGMAGESIQQLELDAGADDDEPARRELLTCSSRSSMSICSASSLQLRREHDVDGDEGAPANAANGDEDLALLSDDREVEERGDTQSVNYMNFYDSLNLSTSSDESEDGNFVDDLPGLRGGTSSRQTEGDESFQSTYTNLRFFLESLRRRSNSHRTRLGLMGLLQEFRDVDDDDDSVHFGHQRCAGNFEPVNCDQFCLTCEAQRRSSSSSLSASDNERTSERPASQARAGSL